jgi:prophage regulatory protein
MPTARDIPPRQVPAGQDPAPRVSVPRAAAGDGELAQAAQGRPNLFPTRLAVDQVLSDLLAELRRRGDRLLDVKQVSDRTTLSRNTIWELERTGRFPSRRQITANKVAWLESEIDGWIASRPTVREVRLAES